MGKTKLTPLVKISIFAVILVALCIVGTYYVIVPLLICLVYGLIEPYRIELKETYIVNGKIPESFEDFKILFVSDIHHSTTYSKKRVIALINKINIQKPDLILLGGDYVNHRSYIEPLFKEMKNFKAGYGILGVLGNHDVYADAKMVKDEMENSGIKCLDNKAAWIYKENARIRIGGVGDFLNGTQDLNPTVNEVNNEFIILLSHNPDYAEDIKTDKIDLVLSGHTHGGQGTIFGLWAPFIPSKYGQKYRTGIVNLQHTKVLVSNGLGNVEGWAPIRFFARPQINIIYLKRTKKQ